MDKGLFELLTDEKLMLMSTLVNPKGRPKTNRFFLIKNLILAAIYTCPGVGLHFI